HQVVAAVTALHGDGIAQAAQVDDFLKKNELHVDGSRFVSGDAGLPARPQREAVRTRGRRPQAPAAGSEVVVGVRQQRQETGALDRGGKLALVLGLGTGDAAGNNLAGLGDVLAQGVEILVIDLGHAFGSELAELAATEELGHGVGFLGAGSQAALSSLLSSSLSLASDSVELDRLPSPSSSRRRRSGFSSLVFMVKDCSVSAGSRRITRWSRTASLKR